MPAIKLEHIYKSFSKDFTLEDINLSFDTPGIVAIIGKSGSGKSTLGNIIGGLLKPDKGNIYIDGVDLYSKSDDLLSEYRNQHVGFIFQHYNLLPYLTAYENIIIPSLINGDDISLINKNVLPVLEKIKLVNIKDQNIKTLSGGEKERVAIIRSMMNSPSIVIADEPTGALDKINTNYVIDFLIKISKSKIVFLITHNLKIVEKYANRIIELKDGKIIRDKEIKVNAGYIIFNKNKTKKSTKFVQNQGFSLFKRHFKRNLFSIIGLIFSLSSMFLMLGFSFNNKEEMQIETLREINYGVSYISKKETYQIDGYDVKLNQLSRLTNNDLNKYKKSDYYFDICYEYLIPNSMPFSHSDVSLDQISFLPIFSFENGNLLNGLLPDNFNDEVVINKECESFLKTKLNINDVLDLKIKPSYKTSYRYLTYDDKTPYIDDTFIFDKEITITGVVEDFSFLSTPKIYYHYLSFKDYLSTFIMNNYSSYTNNETSWIKFISEANSKDKITSYKHLMFYINNNKSSFYYNYLNLKNDSNIELTNQSIEVSDAYLSLIEASKVGLSLFVLIAVFGSLILVSLVSFTSYIEDKKSISILSALGESKKNIIKSYLIENLIVTLLSFSISLIVSIGLEKLINFIIRRTYFISSLISIPFKSFFGIPFLLPIAFLAITLLMSVISSYIPIKFNSKIDISKELKDE